MAINGKKINYLIATWSGSRYSQSKDYLKVHLKQLFSVKHNLDQITIIRPLGSNNDDFYNIEDIIPELFKDKVFIINRPANDRSYGQFIYAYQQYTDQFDYYIIVEDDYMPGMDDFDTILVDLIEEKGADYLCGKYARQAKRDRDRAIHNQGIVKSSSFKKLLEHTPSPKYPVMGPEDGTEQLIFSEHFTDAGMVIKDYSDSFSVPYWAKTLMYFSEEKSFNTIFIPYQVKVLPIDSHFLCNIGYTISSKKHVLFQEYLNNQYNGKIFEFSHPSSQYIVQEPQIDLYPHNGIDVPVGVISQFIDNDGKLNFQCFINKNINNIYYTSCMLDRLSWENRGENVYTTIDIINNDDIIKKLKELNWEIVNEQVLENITRYKLMKDYRNW